jgi:hypothetical protein
MATPILSGERPAFVVTISRTAKFLCRPELYSLGGVNSFITYFF